MGAGGLLDASNILTSFIGSFKALGPLLTGAATGLTAVTGAWAPLGLALGAGVVAITALVGAIKDARAAYTDNIQAIKAYEVETENLNSEYLKSQTEIESTKSAADGYIDKLEELEKQASDGVDVQEEYHDTLEKLVTVMPSLADSIDLDTDSIDGSTTALRENTEEWYNNAKAQASLQIVSQYLEAYNAVLGESLEVRSKINVAQTNLDKAQLDSADYVSQMISLASDYNVVLSEQDIEIGNVITAATEVGDSFTELYGLYLDSEEAARKYSNEIYQLNKAEEKHQDALTKEQEKIKGVADQLGVGLNFTEEGVAVLSENTEALEENADALEGVGEAADIARTKLEQFRGELDPGDTLDQYQKQYQEFAEAMAAGKYGAPEVQAAVDLFVPEEKAKELGYDLQREAEWLYGAFGESATAAILASEEPLQAFSDLILANKAILEDSGIAQFAEDGGMAISSYEELADALGLNEPLVRALFDAFQELTANLIVDGTEVDNYVAELNTKLPAGVDTATASFAEIIAAISETNQTADPEEIRKYFNMLVATGKLKVDPDISTDELDEAFASAYELWQELGAIDAMDVSATIEINTAEALQKIQTLTENIRYAQALAGSAVSVGSSSRKISGYVMAKGTDYAPGGPTLVNDGEPVHGSPAELIVQDGEAFIANNGQPTVVNLKRGAQVYTAEETYQMTGGMTSGSFPAYGVGTFVKLTPTKTTTSSSSSYKSSGSSSKSYSSSTSSTPDVATASASTVSDSEALKDWFDDWVKAKKHALAMDEISEADYYRDLEAMNEKYLKNKKDLQDDYWKYQEEIYKWQKGQIEDINELEEKFDALAKARSQKALVYSEGLFQYVQNTEAIAEAERAFKFGALDAENEALLRAIAAGEGIGYSGLGSYSKISGFTGQPIYGTSYGDTFNIGTVNVEEASNVDDIIGGIKNVALQTSAKR